MKERNSTNLTTRKYAGLLTAACCLYGAALAQATEADVSAGASGRVSLQASQSGDAAPAPVAEANASTDARAGAGVRQDGAEASAEVAPAASGDGTDVAIPAVADFAETALGSAPGEEPGVKLGEPAIPGAPLAGEDSVGSEVAATVTGEIGASALDAVVDSAVHNEIATAVESSVQGEIETAIENDLVNEVAESLPVL